MPGQFSTIDAALTDLRSGKMVLLCDPPPGQPTASLAFAAQFASPERINFMVRHCRGSICLALPPDRCDALRLPPMTTFKDSQVAAAFAVSIEARRGLSTGIPVHDRAHTIQVAIDPRSRPEDLERPGHVFPLRTSSRGVLEEPRQPEAAVDLARAAALSPAGVICSVLHDDGGVPGSEELEQLSLHHDLKLVSVADLIMYRCRTERQVEPVVELGLPTAHGEFRAIGFRGVFDGKQHVALVKGEVAGVDEVIVHVHSRCLPGDVFGSLRCDCRSQLRDALAAIERAGRGVVLYLAQDEQEVGRAGGWLVQALRDHTHHSVGTTAQVSGRIDHREHGLVRAILADLGLATARLMTNSHDNLV